MARRWTSEEIKLRNQMRLGKIPRKYTVKGGDSWFKIAGRLYAKYFGGDEKQAQRMAGELARANKGIGRLRAGITLKLPTPPIGGRTPYIAPGQFGLGAADTGATIPTTTTTTAARTAAATAPAITDVAPSAPPDGPPPTPPGRGRARADRGRRTPAVPTVAPSPAGFGGLADPRRGRGTGVNRMPLAPSLVNQYNRNRQGVLPSTRIPGTFDFGQLIGRGRVSRGRGEGYFPATAGRDRPPSSGRRPPTPGVTGITSPYAPAGASTAGAGPGVPATGRGPTPQGPGAGGTLLQPIEGYTGRTNIIPYLLERGILPININPVEIEQLGLDPSLLVENGYYQDEWGMWVLPFGGTQTPPPTTVGGDSGGVLRGGRGGGGGGRRPPYTGRGGGASRGYYQPYASNQTGRPYGGSAIGLVTWRL